MRDITINIHEFGPLREVELKLKPLTFLMGASSLGKSYANYLFYYLAKMLQPEARLIPDKFPIDEEKKTIEKEIDKAFIERRLHEEAEPFMRNFLGNDGLTCDVDFNFNDTPAKLTFRYSFVRQVLHQISNGKAVEFELFHFSGTLDGKHHYNITVPFKERMPYLAFTSCLSGYLLGYGMTTPFVLPPGRGALVGENYTVKQKTGSSMGLYEDFLTQYDSSLRRKGKQKVLPALDQLMTELCGGKLTSEKEQQFLLLKSGYKLPLCAAASSIKELSPFFVFVMNQRVGGSICFDEPEAHLHPQMQVKVADLIAACFNNGNLFQITTHSDYFMSRINQLIKLGAINDKDKNLAKTLCEQMNVPRIAMLKKENIGAYYFERNEDGGVKVESLEVSDHGIPFATFYDTLSKDRSDDEKISSTYYKLMHKEGE